MKSSPSYRATSKWIHIEDLEGKNSSIFIYRWGERPEDTRRSHGGSQHYGCELDAGTKREVRVKRQRGVREAGLARLRDLGSSPDSSTWNPHECGIKVPQGQGSVLNLTTIWSYRESFGKTDTWAHPQRSDETGLSSGRF